MRKIILLCAQGLSTGVLMSKMRMEAQRTGYDCLIEAHAVAEAKLYRENADILLLGPQVRFDEEQVVEVCPGVPVAVIDMTAYGRMDGAKVIEQVRQILGD